MPALEQIRILAVDDHPLLSEGLATVIRNQPDMLLVGEACSGREAIQAFRGVHTSGHTHGSAASRHERH
jgi:DNA-binding NarL/FixJ family response regulator